MKIFFWISSLVLFYAYLGYGLLLYFLSLLVRRSKPKPGNFLAPVTVVVTAYNEEAFIAQKISNCFSLRYPSELLTFLFVTDGSTDSTASIVASNPALFHLHQPERLGKAAAINRAMEVVSTPFVVFTDANTALHPDSIRKLMRHYQDETVGGVSGEKRINATDKTPAGTGESIYWLYESTLKKVSARFYTVVGAAGELFSIRSRLFQSLDESTILDDFIISTNVVLQGYRMAYDSDAYALEGASVSIPEEQKRKIRISAGCFQALVVLKNVFNPNGNWRFIFQYVSHRVLRWVVCPLLVPLLFISNGLLAFQSGGTFFPVLFGLQCAFYILALVGWGLAGRKYISRIFLIPFYFLFMNVSLYIGFIRFVTGKQTAVWKKALRQPA